MPGIMLSAVVLGIEESMALTLTQEKVHQENIVCIDAM